MGDEKWMQERRSREKIHGMRNGWMLCFKPFCILNDSFTHYDRKTKWFCTVLLPHRLDADESQDHKRIPTSLLFSTISSAYLNQDEAFKYLAAHEESQWKLKQVRMNIKGIQIWWNYLQHIWDFKLPFKWNANFISLKEKFLCPTKILAILIWKAKKVLNPLLMPWATLPFHTFILHE
jgi:hypothetical protein